MAPDTAQWLLSSPPAAYVRLWGFLVTRLVPALGPSSFRVQGQSERVAGRTRQARWDTAPTPTALGPSRSEERRLSVWSPPRAVGGWGSDVSDVTVFGTSALAAKGRRVWPHPSQRRGRCVREWASPAGLLPHRHTAPGTANSCRRGHRVQSAFPRPLHRTGPRSRATASGPRAGPYGRRAPHAAEVALDCDFMVPATRPL